MPLIDNQSNTDLLRILDEVEGEVISAIENFPNFNSGHEGFAIIYEEVQELWKEVMKKQFIGGTKNLDPVRAAAMRNEAIQIAAMAIRFALDSDYFKN